jgi:plasmid stability protein
VGSELSDLVFGVGRTEEQGLDGMPQACHAPLMANLQVKNVPDTLHQRLRRYARVNRCTISEVVLTAVERELARREWQERLAERPPNGSDAEHRNDI